MPAPQDKLAAKHDVECTHCGSKSIIQLHVGCGFQMGHVIPMDSTNIAFARCFRCKRHTLKIISVPQADPPPKLKGFRHVPEK